MSGAPLARAFTACLESGLATLDRRLPLADVGRNGRNFVLMYHSVTDAAPLARSYGNVSPERLERDLAYFSDVCTISDLDTVVERRARDEKRVALTFDDGFRNFYDRVVPLLREYDAPATVFVSPGLGSDPDRARDALELPVADADLFMSERQLAELADEPLVTVGNHTRTHPDLTTLGPEEQRREIVDARETLEAILDEPVRRFCYPYGKFDATSSAIVASSHDLAVSASPGPVERECDVMHVPRLFAHVSAPRLRWEVADLRWQLSSAVGALSASES